MWLWAKYGRALPVRPSVNCAMAPSPPNSCGNKDEVDNEPNNVGVDASKRKQPEENHENGEQPTGLVRLEKGKDGMR